MRIIAGEAKGRKLKSIKGTPTRPTLARVKEAIFSILGPSISGNKGLDLFAGFGGLGLEALSRGLAHLIFVEKNYRNCKIIRDNIRLCKFEERSVIKKNDVFYFLNNCQEKFDLILLDPPYGKGIAIRVVDLIYEKKLLLENGLIVVEHNEIDKMKEFSDWEIVKEKDYGDTKIIIYRA